jgi:hypothetical protein
MKLFPVINKIEPYSDNKKKEIFKKSFNKYKQLTLSTKIVGRKWLKQIITNWLIDTDNNYKILWLLGSPGIGKSSVLNDYLKEIENDQSSPIKENWYIVCSHFFKSDDIIEQNPNRAILHFFIQCLVKDNDFCQYHYKGNGEISDDICNEFEKVSTLRKEEILEEISKTIINDFNNKSMSAALLLNKYIIDPFFLINPCKRLVFLFDAVDEMSDDSNLFLKEITGQIKSEKQFNIKLLISSRNPPEYYQIDKIFPYSLHSEDPRSVSDIRKFLNENLKNFLIDGYVNDTILNRIIQCSSGNFLYLHYFSYLIKYDRSFNLYTSEYPSGLNNLYNMLFNSIFEYDVNEKQKYYKNYIEPYLSVLCVTKIPLLKTEFYDEIVKKHKKEEFFTDDGSFIQCSVEMLLLEKFSCIIRDEDCPTISEISNRIDHTLSILKTKQYYTEFKDKISNPDLKTKNRLEIFIDYEIRVLMAKLAPFFSYIEVENHKYIRPNHRSFIEWLTTISDGQIPDVKTNSHVQKFVFDPPL